VVQGETGFGEADFASTIVSKDGAPFRFANGDSDEPFIFRSGAKLLTSPNEKTFHG
jgi:hypothetical protein